MIIKQNRRPSNGDTTPPSLNSHPHTGLMKAHNANVRRVHALLAKVSGTGKRSHGLRRMRWVGLAKAGVQVRLAAMACTLRRSWRLLAGSPA